MTADLIRAVSCRREVRRAEVERVGGAHAPRLGGRVLGYVAEVVQEDAESCTRCSGRSGAWMVIVVAILFLASVRRTYMIWDVLP